MSYWTAFFITTMPLNPSPLDGKNASAFGFYLVYDRDSLRKGFQYEPTLFLQKNFSLIWRIISKTMCEKIKKDTTVLGHRVMDSLFLAGYKEEHFGDSPPTQFKINAVAS